MLGRCHAFLAILTLVELLGKVAVVVALQLEVHAQVQARAESRAVAGARFQTRVAQREPFGDFNMGWTERREHSQSMNDGALQRLLGGASGAVQVLRVMLLGGGLDQATHPLRSAAVSWPLAAANMLGRLGKCGEDSVHLAGSDVELVISTFDDSLRWLARVDTPTTVYVHERQGRHTHCYGEDKRCPEMSKARLLLAQDSQRYLQSLTQRRKHAVNFVDIPNVGDEAYAFLTHIVKKYDDLPAALVFLHGHALGWHAPFLMDQHLRSTCFPLREGYRSLNGGPDYQKNSKCYDFDNVTLGSEAAFFSETLSRHWLDIYEPYLGELPRRTCVDCCSQFVVSRERLLRYPKTFYENLLRIVMAGDTSMEREWRMLFVCPGHDDIAARAIDSTSEAC